MSVREIRHIGDLKLDPKNARKHNPRNIGMLEDALHEVGAARSIVIDEDGVILAGNGVVEAAGAAGIERVTVVEADGNEIIAVRRTGLTPHQKQRLALYDNRVAELADWDGDMLATLAMEDAQLLDGMWSAEELDTLLVGLDVPDVAEDQHVPEQWMVVVTCESESQQGELLGRLTEEGYTCRALIS